MRTDTQPKTTKKPPMKGMYPVMAVLTAYLMVFTAVPNEITALLALVMVALFSLVFLRSKTLVALSALLLTVGVLYSGSLVASASLVASVLIIGMGAMAILHIRVPVSVLLAVAAYAAALILTGDFAAAAYVFVPIPCMVVSAVLLACGAKRTTAICAAAATYLATLAVPFLFALHAQYGSISGDALLAFVNDIHQQLTDAISVVLEEFREMLPEQMNEMLNGSFYSTLAELTLCFTPAILAIAALIPTFFANMVSLIICKKTGGDRRLPEKAKAFEPSKVSAAAFLLSLLISVVTFCIGIDGSEFSLLLVLTAGNLHLILLFAFSVVGFSTIIGLLRQKRGCLNIGLIIGIILLFLNTGVFTVYPIAVAGALHILRSPSLPDQDGDNFRS